MLSKLKSIAGPLNNGVWNESTLPKLRILKINACPNLKRFPMGTDNFSDKIGKGETDKGVPVHTIVGDLQ